MNKHQRPGSSLRSRRIPRPQRRRSRPRLECLEERQLLANVTWIATSSGDWNTPSNWSTGQVPGSGDDVVINVSGANPTVTIDTGSQSVHSLTAQDPLVLSGGSLTVASQSAINGSLTFSGGTLTTNGPLTLGGSTQWTGGTLTLSGQTVTNTGTLTMSSAGTFPLLGSGTLANTGTIDDQLAGGLNLDDSTRLDNQSGGIFDFQVDSGMGNDSGHAAGTFTNEGTLEKSVTSGTSAILVNFANSGTITVQTGTVSLKTSGGTSTGGTFTVAQGATLDLTGGNTVHYTGSYTGSGAGTISLNSGTMQLDGNTSFNFSGSSFQWTGGAINIPGGVTLTNTGVIALAGNSHLFGGGTLSNHGTIDQTGTGGLFLNDSITLDNTAGGTFDFQADSGISNDSGHAAGTLTNEGTLEKTVTAGTGPSTIAVNFANSSGAVIDVAAGTLSLATAGGTNTGGSFTVAAGATLDLTGGHTVNYMGSYTNSGPGTISLNSGTIQLGGNATFDFSNATFQWTGGAINIPGNITVTNAGGITLAAASGSESHLFGGGTLSNQGTIDQTGSGGLFLNDSITLDNTTSGTYDFQADSGIGNDSGHSPGTLTNEGILEKTLPGGATQDTGSSTIQINFDNTGAITVQTGTISLAAVGGTNTGGSFTVAAGATLNLTGGATVNYTGSYTSTGAGTVALSGGTMQIQGNTSFAFPAAMFQWTGGNINIPGSDVVTNTGVINLAGNSHLFGGGRLNNPATIDQTGAGGLFINDSITVDNTASGTYDFQADSGIGNDSGHAAGTLTNEGTLEKTAGSATSTISVNFVNSKAITVQTGTISLKTSGGTSTGGTFTVAQGAALDLTGGNTVHYTGSYTGSGAGTISLNSGTMQLDGNTSFNFSGSSFQWTGGAVNIPGSVTLTNTGVIALAGNSHLFGGGILSNQATIDQTGAGGLFINDSITVDNTASGTYDFQADSGIGNDSGHAAGTLTNEGTLEKTVNAGIGPSVIAVQFANSSGAVLDVAAGTLSLQASGGTNTGGSFTVAQGATLDLTGGNTVNYTGSYIATGGGTIRLQNGTLNVVTTQQSSGMTLDFPGTLFQWTGGGINIPGGVTLTNTGVITLAGNSHLFSGGRLSNQGTIDQTGPGGLNINDSITLDNTPSGIYDFQADSNIGNDSGHAAGTLTNEGIIEKTGATTGTSTIAVNFINSGEIIVQTGTITLKTNGGTSTGGSFAVGAGATLDLTGGNTVHYTGNYTGTGTGTIVLSSGTMQLDGNTSFDFPGAMFQWTGGGINIPGTITLTNTGTITLAGNSHLFSGGTLSNQGTIDQTGAGGLFINDSITLDNTAGGTFDIQVDAAIGNDAGHAAGTLTNEGALEKSQGSGTSTISVNYSSTGTTRVESGTLNLSLTVAQVSGSTLTGGVWTVSNGTTLSFPGSPTITTNQGTITLGGPTATFAAIQPLAVNAGGFNLENGADFTTAGGFSSTGELTVGVGSTLTVAGSFSAGSSGTTTISISGSPASGTFGHISVIGAATLNGALVATLGGGYGPSTGDVFPVVTFAGGQGSFASFNGPTANGAALFNVVNGATSVSLTAQATTADLTVTSITIPSAGLVNDPVSITYAVRNLQSLGTFGNTWTDSAYLSASGTMDASAQLIGQLVHQGALAGGGSYTATLTGTLPAVLPGSYHVIVVVDSGDAIPDSNRFNNAVASSGTIAMDLHAVAFGSPFTGDIADGQDLAYRFDPPANQDVLLTATFAGSPGANFLVSTGAIPTPTHFDLQGSNPNALVQTIPILGAHTGTEYILLQGLDGSGAGRQFTLSSRLLGFEALSIAPAQAINLNSTTITITGSHFTASTTASLVGPGAQVIAASSVQFQNSNTIVATFNLTGAPSAVYDLKLTDKGQAATDTGAFTVFPADRLLFTSDSSAVSSSGTVQAVWSQLLPQPGAGNDTNIPQPFHFAGVQFVLNNYQPGQHAILSGSPDGTAPFNVDGSWTLQIQGPASQTLSGSGSSGPIDLASLNLPAGTYGLQLTLTASPSVAHYGTSDIYLLAAATDLVAQPLPLPPLHFAADPVSIPVGSTGQVVVRLETSPIPFTGMITHFSIDTQAVQILSFTPAAGFSGGGGGSTLGGFSEYANSGTAPLQTGDVAFTINVRMLAAGTFTLPFEGNGFGLGPVVDPTQALNYLVTVADSFAVTGVAPPPVSTVQPIGAQINPADGTLAVTINGSGLTAAASAKLIDGQGNTVATTTNLQVSSSGSLLTATFPVTPAGLDTMEALDSQGHVIATTGASPSLAVPPAVPFLSLVGEDALPQLPGKPVTHFWEVVNQGPVDGVALLSFEFPSFLSPEPSLAPGVPAGTVLLTHGFIDPNGVLPINPGWLENVAVPVPAGGQVEIPWTITLPPAAIFGPNPSTNPGATLNIIATVQADVPQTAWTSILQQQLPNGALNAQTTGQQAVQAASTALATAAAALPQLQQSAQAYATYLNAVQASNPALASLVSNLAPDVEAGLLSATVGFQASPQDFPGPTQTQNNNLPSLPPGIDSTSYDLIATALAILKDVKCGGSTDETTIQVSQDAGLWGIGFLANLNPTTSAYWFARNTGLWLGQQYQAGVINLGFQDFQTARRNFFLENPNLDSSQPLVGANLTHFINFVATDPTIAVLPNLDSALAYMATGDGTKDFRQLSPDQLQQAVAALEFANTVQQLQDHINANKSLFQQFGGWLSNLVYGAPPIPGNIDPCPPSPPRIVNSFDPNNITVSPVGEGDQGFVAPGQSLTYQVSFENEPAATAAAQNIRIVLQLDNNFDPTTLVDGPSSFSGTQFAFDPATSTITWLLPEINLPPDTLPPNGEGSVSFTVTPKAGLPTGTVLSESAQVFFDFNPPIQTPTTVTTIAATAPTSSVAPLPATTTGTNFTVSWSGIDSTGPGIASYSVYVSTDGGPFRIFAPVDTATAAVFTGQTGHSYAFYSVATDAVGNVQPTPTSAQAAITLIQAPTPTPPPPPTPSPTPPPTPTPAPPAVIGQTVLFTRKLNSRHHPVGKPILAGFELDFSTALNPAAAANPGNYQVDGISTRHVKRKKVKVLHPVPFRVQYNASSHTVDLLLNSRPAFAQGGRITVLAAGASGVFTILPRGRGITR